jgi:hypothetical protein
MEANPLYKGRGGGGGGISGMSGQQLGSSMFSDMSLGLEVGMEPIVMEGALKKKSKSMFKGWRTRWFVLDQHALSW